jgi:NTP pyrophosphatase (non-canonical NTP hydrolase)
MDRLKLECALGLCGEAGEVAEQVKKHFFHGHELDKRHMIEELGDVAWYLAVLCDAIGSDLDTVMEENLKKLEQRYPEGFDPYRSQHRNEMVQRRRRENRCLNLGKMLKGITIRQPTTAQRISSVTRMNSRSG